MEKCTGEPQLPQVVRMPGNVPAQCATKPTGAAAVRAAVASCPATHAVRHGQAASTKPEHLILPCRIAP